MSSPHDSAAHGAASSVLAPGQQHKVVLGSWEALGAQARAVRTDVFLIEQRIAAHEEWDEWDALALHAVALDASGTAIGTGRLLPPAFDKDPRIGHIGRMAVLAPARKGGTGGAVLQALMHAAPAQGFAAIVLHAQKSASNFYARHGFVAEGAEFLEVGIPHVTMRAPLAPPPA